VTKYAIIEAGARQYWVQENDVIHVEKLAGEAGKSISLDRVLLVNDGESKFGNPFVAGAKVECEILGNELQTKVINYKFRRRKNSRRKKGHRQDLMMLKVTSIQG